ncbi:WD40-repeat-containing domain protein [Halteromyces radiatus]|uniref:WD40-repeat-containing domain protein n=1 Tax=Halteromyces radiatus TaxID=101107 RepID=UPI002220AF1C|nr:WD40-repeat-containing domain protein [Halteromyces radiatus]KAI8078671.1 WD40-repeat-containing domain protein [Halteromyces radiatus]
MVLPVTTANNVKVYTVSGGLGSRSIPDWLVRKKKKALKKDFDYRTRVELLQDFEFPEASNKIKITKDGNFAVATGTYKPQMRVYEFAEVSMKFERHTDAETVNFELLSDDWTKSVLLQNDRSIELHAQGGIHYRTRVPKFGRDLAYHFPSCDVMVAASGSEVYRLNLDQGRFLNSIQTDGHEGVNCIKINPAHQLFGMGTSNGTVELWDPRSKARVGILDHLPLPPSLVNNTPTEVTALAFRNDGLSMGVGTNTGHTLLYDLRASVPYMVKDHQYGFDIKNIHFHDGVAAASSGDASTHGSDKVVVADKKIVKIWDRNTGKHFTSIEPETDINDVCMVGDSGLMFTAQEGIQMGAYYIPQLGPAPAWASFLENLTEEMEENPNRDVYDEYKFVTRKELSALGLDHLMGTNVLKAYMHGFFVDLRLYEKAKLIANPFAYDDYKQQKVREKLEKERASRIRANKQLPAVNKQLAKQILEDTNNNKKKKNKSNAAEIMEDSRFKDMFADPEFEVDMESKEYELLHPGARKQREMDAFAANSSDDDDDDDDQAMVNDSSDDMDSDDSMKNSDDDEDIVGKLRKEQQRTIEKPKPLTTIRSTERKFKSNDKSFGARLQSSKAQKKNEGHRVSRTSMGGMEMSFKPKSGSRRGGRR